MKRAENEETLKPENEGMENTIIIYNDNMKKKNSSKKLMWKVLINEEINDYEMMKKNDTNNMWKESRLIMTL